MERIKGVEPSQSVWETNMLTVTSHPHKMWYRVGVEPTNNCLPLYSHLNSFLTLHTAKAVGFLLHRTSPKSRSYAFSTSVDYSVSVCPTVHCFMLCRLHLQSSLKAWVFLPTEIYNFPLESCLNPLATDTI